LKKYLKSKARLNKVSIIPLMNIVGAGFEKVQSKDTPKV